MHNVMLMILLLLIRHTGFGMGHIIMLHPFIFQYQVYFSGVHNLLPRAHVQGVMLSVCCCPHENRPIWRYSIGIWQSCNNDQTIKNGTKLAWFGL
jgi:hypothetical protein